jgi:hypothetical protein
MIKALAGRCSGVIDAGHRTEQDVAGGDKASQVGDKASSAARDVAGQQPKEQSGDLTDKVEEVARETGRGDRPGRRADDQAAGPVVRAGRQRADESGRELRAVLTSTPPLTAEPAAIVVAGRPSLHGRAAAGG